MTALSIRGVDAALASGRRKIMDALVGRSVRYVPLENHAWLKNLNTMNDYIEYAGITRTAP